MTINMVISTIGLFKEYLKIILKYCFYFSVKHVCIRLGAMNTHNTFYGEIRKKNAQVLLMSTHKVCLIGENNPRIINKYSTSTTPLFNTFLLLIKYRLVLIGVITTEDCSRQT